MKDTADKKIGFIQKKGILLIADGLGDRPIAALNGQTPSEFAATPTLDKLCREGMAGLVHPYQPGCACGTDWGHLSLFGYDPQGFYSGRGSLEAISAGIELQKGDIAFRGNLATIDTGWQVVDRRAGRIKEQADIAELVAAIDGMTIEDCTFIVKPLTEHRVAVVMRGNELSGGVVSTDPGTGREGHKLVDPTLRACPDNLKTARLLWAFLHKVSEIFEAHPVNERRKQQNLLPANIILTRGCGEAMVIPPFQKQFPGVRPACIAGDETIIGIGKMCNIDGYTQKEFTGGFVTDYAGKARLAVNLLEQYDLVIVHIKGTDLCGHDNLPLRKAQILENIDTMFAYWLDKIDQSSTYLAIVADHSTPCHNKEHSADPVPCFVWGPNVRTDEVEQFGERYMYKGIINNYTGAQLMKTLMDYMAFGKKYGD